MLMSLRANIYTALIVPAVLIVLLLVWHNDSYDPKTLLSLGNHPSGGVPNVHLFFPVDKRSAESEDGSVVFCKTIQGAVVNGWTPILFNWEVESEHQMRKVQGLRDLLDSPVHTAGFEEDDLILMMDAFDVFIQLSPEVAARRFTEYGDVDVMAAAEKNCYPNDPNGHICQDAPWSPLHNGPNANLYRPNDDPNRPYDQEETLPRHVNSGTVIGKLSKMRTFYNELWDFMLSDTYEGWDDQGAFGIFLTDQPVKTRLSVDYHSRLFWPGFQDFQNIRFMGTHYPPDPSTAASYSDPEASDYIPWDLYPMLAHHRKTGEVPVALHFNGPIKELINEWWGQLWWSSQRDRFLPIIHQRMSQGKVLIAIPEGYREMPVQELCPHMDIWQWQSSHQTTDGRGSSVAQDE
ncbi:hypothetical protein BD324DRAFT_613666 [Kockovaella imperatae]|uniref:Uncharacterized protein n=1 Tax=Kockovaella imperatae TaxID=4999 RepID=A0A1Y1UUS0_9TREE|nr:hypothetical protein BD324DRAFT_613666 [Kockovaella imperatae]ORX41216.1 hypothetical protein BD324DRAFT_613666 [Kockovaella imperatae]